MSLCLTMQSTLGQRWWSSLLLQHTPSPVSGIDNDRRRGCVEIHGPAGFGVEQFGGPLRPAAGKVARADLVRVTQSATARQPPAQHAGSVRCDGVGGPPLPLPQLPAGALAHSRAGHLEVLCHVHRIGAQPKQGPHIVKASQPVCRGKGWGAACRHLAECGLRGTARAITCGPITPPPDPRQPMQQTSGRAAHPA